MDGKNPNEKWDTQNDTDVLFKVKNTCYIPQKNSMKAKAYASGTYGDIFKVKKHACDGKDSEENSKLTEDDYQSVIKIMIVD